MSMPPWMRISVFVVLSAGVVTAAGGSSALLQKPNLKCPSNNSVCADIAHHLQTVLGKYSGHDEPAITFYSNTPGAGNSFTTVLTLPTDPPTLPQQDGSGGTFSFQLYPAFWFSMILCDTQSTPVFSPICTPNTDANIFNNPDPNAPDFIGRHPGSAFLELQFYPPVGINVCSDPQLWCVAMTIDSFNFQSATNLENNADCLAKVGIEPINLAFLTTNGISQFVADPLSSAPNPLFNTVPGELFKMNPGDRIRVVIHDTPDGVKTEVTDLNTGATGSMTGSVANGFTQVNFAPDPDPMNPSVPCTSTPYAFHPQYETASEQTRAMWLAHSANVAFSAEVGHYELCSAVDFEGGSCIGASPADPAGPDFDDQALCFSGSFAASFGLLPIGACIDGDFDFDATSYGFNWPGTGPSAADALLHPSPIRFEDPRFIRQEHADDGQDEISNSTRYDGRGRLQNFSRLAFETNVVTSEFFTNPNCNLNSGDNCTDPPTGTQFYPFYSMTHAPGDGENEGVCLWQLGGPDIPGTVNNFGGSATVAYGSELHMFFPTAADTTHPNGTATLFVNDFRRILSRDPCREGD